MKKKSSTALDTLYDLLQEKKELKIEDISKRFNVSEEVVTNWGKVLEAGDLAIINHPRIGKESIIIIEKETEEKPAEKKDGKPKKIEKPKLKKQDIKTIERANKTIKKQNRERIRGAKELIAKLREMEHTNPNIKKLFTEKGWPEDLIDDLLKR